MADKELGSDSASANEIPADTQSNNSSSTKSFSVDEVRAMISEYRKRPTSFDDMEVSEASLQLSQVLKRQRNWLDPTVCQVSAASKSDIHFNEPNSEVRFHIATALAEVADSEAKIYPRMELDSHANMVLLGKDK